MRSTTITTNAPVKISYMRAAWITLLALAVTYVLLIASFLIVDPPKDVFDYAILPAIIMATSIPIMVAFPIAVILQRERLKLALAHGKLEQMHERLETRARTDALTKLLNRDAFMSDVSQHLSGKGNHAILMIDVDHFKAINDTYGHPAGDEALRLVAGTIRSAVRPEDIVGRLGGEEFGVCALNCDEVLAWEIAERVRTQVCHILFQPDPNTRHAITVSIGVALDDHHMQLNEMVRMADRGLYSAKEAGRNQTIVYQAA